MTREGSAAVVDPRERYSRAFASVEGDLPGTALQWLRENRHAALEHFREVGFPSPRQEDWKYTRLGAIERRAFKAAASFGGISAAEIDRWTLAGTRRLVFVNGRYARELSATDGLPPGVRVCSLASAIAEGVEGLEGLLSDGSEPKNGFDSLNAAFWRDGAYIDLGDGTSLERPVHLLFVASEPDILIHPRTVVRARAGARVAIVEHYVSLGDGTGLTNVATRILVESGARVEHCKLQEEASTAFHVGSIAVRQRDDSRFASCSFALGAALSRTDISTRLEAPGCEATLNGLYVTAGRQHVDHHTSIDHLAERGTSREWYRGVLSGQSRAVFNGKVLVHPGAQRTDAHQSNRNLLLSEGAEVDTKPQLEIYADDVKCSHGATVGALDAEQIFYLRSRGLEEGAARSMLTLAFADDIVGRCGIEPVRDRVRALLPARLTDTTERTSA